MHSLRVVMYWKNVAPSPDATARPGADLTDPAAYDWGQYDAVVQAARERGWNVLMTLTTPGPKWAMRGHRDYLTSPSPALFGRFVTAAARHFGDQVNQWAILNEPNHPDFLLPQYSKKGHRPLSPRIYRSLFQAADKALTGAGHGRDLLLMGETAPRGTGKVVAPITFLRGVLCLNGSYRRDRKCGRLNADGYAHHAYTTKVGPYFVPPQQNDVTIGVLSRLTRALDKAGRAGAIRRNLPLYLTEFGIQSTPDRFFGVSLTKQPEYRAIAERIAYGNPRVKAFSQYLLRDDPPIDGKIGASRYGGFESGLMFANGRPKPALDGFRLPLVALRSGSRVSVWGMVRPATAPTTATVQAQDPGSRAFRPLKTVRTNARGVFQFRTSYRKGRRYRLVWGDAQGVPVRVYKAR